MKFFSRKKKPASKRKDFFRFLAVMAFLMVFLLSFIIFMVIFTIGFDDPREAVSKENFAEVLKDSIKLYGEDFTLALAVYLMEHRSFEDYDIENFSHTREEMKGFMKEPELQEMKEEFDKHYGGMVKEKDGKAYYDWYFPISSGYEINYTNDWGNNREYNGNQTQHTGTDIMCDEGTPIIAVESGKITGIGWNELGGWRISIESVNGERFWYYAHMRKVHPYVRTLKMGSEIKGGQVIGYVGSTGYSDAVEVETMPENPGAVDGKFAEHLHIGVYRQEKFVVLRDRAYNPFPVMEVLRANMVKVELKEDEYAAIEKTVEERLVRISISGDNLGSLSQKYESGGNVGTIANNSGDIGGKSYGAFQLASNMGSVDSFLMWLNGQDLSLYNRLANAKSRDGGVYGDNFDNEWRAIAKEQPEYFYNLQYLYIKSSYFDPLVSYYNPKGFYIEQRSITLQNVIFSLSVQHGVGGAKVIINKQDLTATDKIIIIGIYQERMKVDIYFSGSSPEIRQSVYNRFKNELQDALEMLAEEEGG